MHKTKVVAIGSALRDIFLVTDSAMIIENLDDLECKNFIGFELGAKTNIKKFFNTIGGAALNVAIGLKKMGIDSYPCVEVGDDIIGDVIRREIGEMKISTKLIQKDKFKQTGFSFIIVDGRTREHVAFCSKEASEDIKINIKKILAIKPDWIYLGSLGKHPEDEYLRIKSVKKQRPAVKIAANPGIVQIEKNKKELLDFLKICDILFLNHDEAVSMASSIKTNSIPEGGIKQMRFLLRESAGWGAKIAAITDGEDGAYLRAEDGAFYWVEGVPPRKLVDTTGAGDAFVSGFLAGFMGRKSIEDCLKMGVLNGSRVTESLGAWQNLIDENQKSSASRRIKNQKIGVYKI